jgi:hypothetical protein
MDLLRRVQENRLSKGHAMRDSIHNLPHPTNEVTRAYIIEKKPKHKVLKTYFEELVQEIIDDDTT